MIEAVGYVNFYLITTVAAVPGIVLFWLMMRSGLIDSSIGSAGIAGPDDARTVAGNKPTEEGLRAETATG